MSYLVLLLQPFGLTEFNGISSYVLTAYGDKKANL